MNQAISKLEAEILNLQTAEQAVIDQADMAYRKGAEEVTARIAAKGYKGVVIKALPVTYEEKRFTGCMAVQVPLEYRNDKFLNTVVDEVKTPLDGKFGKLALRIVGIKGQISERMSELVKFTEIETVRPSSGGHFHLFTVRGDKVYLGQVRNLVIADGYFDEGMSSAEGIDRFKATTNCPMYIATNPSGLTGHELMITYAVTEILKEMREK